MSLLCARNNLSKRQPCEIYNFTYMLHFPKHCDKKLQLQKTHQASGEILLTANIPKKWVIWGVSALFWHFRVLRNKVGSQNTRTDQFSIYTMVFRLSHKIILNNTHLCFFFHQENVADYILP